jgi:hypothetical protein
MVRLPFSQSHPSETIPSALPGLLMYASLMPRQRLWRLGKTNLSGFGDIIVRFAMTSAKLAQRYHDCKDHGNRMKSF